MTGEYPIATLRFQDPELPVHVEVSAFTPFAPLDSKFSSQPLAALIFRIHNPTAASQTVSLAGLMQNPIGYDATTPSNGVANAKFGGNVCEPFHAGKAAGLFMRAEPGKEQSLDRPVFLQVAENLRVLEQFGRDRPKNLVLAVMPNGVGPRLDAPPDAKNIVWLSDPETMPLHVVEQIQKAVDAGATLVVSGGLVPLLHQYARYRQHRLADHAVRADIVFEDFENGFDKWVVEGKAFGQKPASGALDGQSPVLGFEGKGFANSYHGLDLTTGRLTSKPFTVARDYICFLIGGGSRETTQMRLIVDGRVVRTVQGMNAETLASSVWDVREFAGKKAHIEIVDDDKEPWGHINVDHIVFSDEGFNAKTMAVLDKLLPAGFDAVGVVAGKQPVEPNALVFKNLQLQPDASQATLSGGLKVMLRPVGKGHVVLVGGAIADPGRMDQFEPQQEAYAALCEIGRAQVLAVGGCSAHGLWFWHDGPGRLLGQRQRLARL